MKKINPCHHHKHAYKQNEIFRNPSQTVCNSMKCETPPVAFLQLMSLPSFSQLILPLWPQAWNLAQGGPSRSDLRKEPSEVSQVPAHTTQVSVQSAPLSPSRSWAQRQPARARFISLGAPLWDWIFSPTFLTDRSEMKTDHPSPETGQVEQEGEVRGLWLEPSEDQSQPGFALFLKQWATYASFKPLKSEMK